jgi:carbon storage regulator CsrA
MPLKLKRRVGQTIVIDEWKLTITNITQGAVEMIIDAPQHVQITRGEAKDKVPRTFRGSQTMSTSLSHTIREAPQQ